MKLIVGLGNPGEEHEQTRHNSGFMAVEKFLKDFKSVGQTVWEDNKDFKSDISRIDYQPKHRKLEKVILAKPKTYMNNSGMAVNLLATYYKLQATDIWIIHDEIDLLFGSLRIRIGGSSAGHRGIESIMQRLGTEKFWRFRMGIGHPKKHENLVRPKHAGEQFQMSNNRKVEEYVLEPFSSDEKGTLKHLLKHTSDAISEALENGIESAVSKYTTK